MSERRNRFLSDINDSNCSDRLKFTHGQEVFVKTNNDSFTLGVIHKVRPTECIVNIEDKYLKVPYENLRPWSLNTEESSLGCSICKNSKQSKTNVIVNCEVCFRRYHQSCHEPVIKVVLQKWVCMKCTNAKNSVSIKNRKSGRHSQSTTRILDSYTDRNIVEKSLPPTRTTTNIVTKECISESRCFDRHQCESVIVQLPDILSIKNKHSLPPSPPASVNGVELSSNQNDTPICVSESDTEFSDSNSPNINENDLIIESKSRPLPKINCKKSREHLEVNCQKQMRTRGKKREIIQKKVMSPNAKRRNLSSNKRRNIATKQKSDVIKRIVRKGTKKLRKRSENILAEKPDISLQLKHFFDKKLVPDIQPGVPAIQTSFKSFMEYKVCGKRVTSTGEVQYLVEWLDDEDVK